jgi:nicotinate-nucleotide adenylyltransferase
LSIPLPPHTSGLKIGLFGGSFNPAHEGHLLVARTALKRLKLDRVWWLVTPGNPLKDIAGLPGQAMRMAQCRALIGPDPRIVVTGIEAQIGTRYTEETIRFLKTRCPGVRFVWLMGADNLAGFHHWRNWRAIASAVPMAVIDRPGSTLRATASRAARTFSAARRDEREAARLATMPAPAWVLLHGRRSTLSSTMLRGEAENPAMPGNQ